MADLLIKGMKMPQNCAECRFYGEYCYAKGDENKYSKLPCPLVPVPPHGRLIDADEILKGQVSNAYISRFDVDYAPTVIEASEE